MNVPFLDLQAQYRLIKDEIDNAINNVIQDAAFVHGKYVSDFEERYADAFNVRKCLSCANGTDALYIALKALGVGPGDEVITTALSWIATSETITQVGARVVFVDIEPNYFTIDPENIEEKITKKTRAIIPVHLYGQPAKMDRILEIARQNKLFVIEDCAQAHFARFKGRLVGTMGNVGTFSFYPGKNLGAYGDAGALISNDESLIQRARMFANHGGLRKHSHQIEGINSRLDGLQAAILSVKLRHLEKWTARRKEIANIYNGILRDDGDIEIPLTEESRDHVYHLYVIRSRHRDQLQQRLKKNGVSSGIHYPVALPFLPAYRYLECSKDEFPVVSQYQDQIMSIPIYPEMTREMIKYVCNVILGNPIDDNA